ncbi:MAG: ABC transporter permease [Bacteroidetes bacterium]|nr:ABC transporter permease [Bacteroidota bacterium]
MSAEYSQRKAMLAVTRASLTAILRSPSAVIFSFGFPLIFIFVFGFMSEGKPTIQVGFTDDSDTVATNMLYRLICDHEFIRVVKKEQAVLWKDMQKGRITAILSLRPAADSGFPRYNLEIVHASAGNDKIGLLQTALRDINYLLSQQDKGAVPLYASIKTAPPVPGRIYRTIDFILPGQLGFSLLSAGVFGVAFVFFNLRQTMVLKRFFATPISRTAILMGEGLARMLFQLSTAVVILLIGYFAFGFTLVNGWVTFLELLALSALGLMVFMGFGFVVSGLARNESMIPPFANMITLPQFLLAGTFFSIESFPSWLQPLCRFLPLTHLNNAMRNIAFEGSHLTDCTQELGILLIWGLVIYMIAVKVFKWEN